MSAEIRLGSVVCVALGLLLAVTTPLAAQDTTAGFPALRTPVFQDVVVDPALSPAASTPRPSVLLPLYISFGVLQVLDLTSTYHAIGGNGREGNPVVGGVIGSPAAAIALKAGVTTGIIVLSEKLRKKNRVAAIVMMATMNSAYAIVTSHNYALAH